MERLRVATPPGFRFRPTVTSHGWVDLPPFGHDEEFTAVRRTLRLGGGTVVDLEECPAGGDDVESETASARGARGAAGGGEELDVRVEAPGAELEESQQEEIRRRVGRLFPLASMAVTCQYKFALQTKPRRRGPGT